MKQKRNDGIENDAKITGWELLAIAICKNAADDYAKELVLSDKQGKKTGGAKAIEGFFLSDWGEMLSFGKGELILELLREKRAKKTYRKRNAYPRTNTNKKKRKEL